MNEYTQATKVERITLEGKVTHIEPMPEEWHLANVGPREVGTVVKYVRQGLSLGRYVKIELTYQNPLNGDRPAILERAPIRDSYVSLGQSSSLEAYVVNGNLYIETLKSVDPNTGPAYTLQAAHEDTTPKEIENFVVEEETQQ